MLVNAHVFKAQPLQPLNIFIRPHYLELVINFSYH